MMESEVAANAVEFGSISLIATALVLVAVGGLVGAYLHGLASGGESRPIYLNLIFFAFIGAAFSVIAMSIVDADDRSGIALLYLGLIGGYAASIKELDLAKIEIEKLKLKLKLGDKENGGKERPDQEEEDKST